MDYRIFQRRSWRSLEVFGLEAGMFGDTRQHARADFLFIVECKYEIRPAGTLKGFV